MLPRPLRLTESAEYQRLFQDAATGHGRLVTVRVAPSDEPRAGVIVSKRTAPLAVDRNRIKRRLRPLLRGALTTYPEYRMAVIAKPPARRASSEQLAADLADALDQAVKKVDAPDRR